MDKAVNNHSGQSEQPLNYDPSLALSEEKRDRHFAGLHESISCKFNGAKPNEKPISPCFVTDTPTRIVQQLVALKRLP